MRIDGITGKPLAFTRDAARHIAVMTLPPHAEGKSIFR